MRFIVTCKNTATFSIAFLPFQCYIHHSAIAQPISYLTHTKEA